MAVVKNELRADLVISGGNKARMEMRQFAAGVENAGDELREMGRDAGYLERRLAELRLTQVALTKQLNATGDTGLIKSINQARRELRQYERIAREAAAVGPEVVTSAITDGMSKPILAAGVIAAIGALLPGIGAMVSGAISGVTGFGGIIGGVVAAAHDPKVKAAAKELAAVLGPEFTDAGAPMVEPLVQALAVLREDGRAVAADLKQGFATLAPELVPVTKGLTGLVREMMPGLLAAFEASRPVLRAMSAELPKIGHAIGEFFRITTQDSDAAVLGFIALSRTIQNVLVDGAKFINILATIYKGMVVNGEAVTSMLQKTTGWLSITGLAGQAYLGTLNDQHDMYQGLLDDMNKAVNGTGAFTDGLSSMGSAASQAAADVEDLKRASDELFNITMNVDQANLHWAQGLRDLKKELADGAKTLNINNEEGAKNVEVLLRQVQAAESVREALIAQGVPLDQANEKYLQQIEAIKQLAIKMGIARDEVDKFIAKYMQIPNAKTIEINLKAGGDAAAWAALRNLERAQESMGAPKPFLPGSVEFRAGGGPVSAGRGYIVGENGPEFFSPSTGGYVSSASQTSAMMSGASGGSARPIVNIYLQSSGDAAADAFMNFAWPLIKRQIRVDGGDLGSVGA